MTVLWIISKWITSLIFDQLLIFKRGRVIHFCNISAKCIKSAYSNFINRYLRVRCEPRIIEGGETLSSLSAILWTTQLLRQTGMRYVFNHLYIFLTLPMLRPLSSEAQKCKDFSQTIEILSRWYSLNSSHWVLSDEYPYARVSTFFRFLHHLVLAKLATSSIRVPSSRLSWYPTTGINVSIDQWFSPLSVVMGKKNDKLLLPLSYMHHIYKWQIC